MQEVRIVKVGLSKEVEGIKDFVENAKLGAKIESIKKMVCKLKETLKGKRGEAGKSKTEKPIEQDQRKFSYYGGHQHIEEQCWKKMIDNEVTPPILQKLEGME